MQFKHLQYITTNQLKFDKEKYFKKRHKCLRVIRAHMMQNTSDDVYLHMLRNKLHYYDTAISAYKKELFIRKCTCTLENENIAPVQEAVGHLLRRASPYIC